MERLSERADLALESLHFSSSFRSKDHILSSFEGKSRRYKTTDREKYFHLS
jgi:hypothetical protein